MRFEAFPTREKLEKHARIIPEIEPSAVLAMLRISQAAEIIRSTMVKRMVRDGLTTVVIDQEDKRGKKVSLTAQGRQFMDQVLPGHYLRISTLMNRLSEDEQAELIRLLTKLSQK